MNAIIQLASVWFRDLFRYTRGGDPIPEALDAQAEFLSGREELSSEKWVAEALGSVNVRPEIARFAHDFFASFNIPIGKIRCSDRLKDDLHLKEALRDDCDEDLVDEFKRRFNRRLRKWPHIETMGDLLLFLDRRAQDG
jgi:hypothetical protein